MVGPQTENVMWPNCAPVRRTMAARRRRDFVVVHVYANFDKARRFNEDKCNEDSAETGKQTVANVGLAEKKKWLSFEVKEPRVSGF